MAGFLSDVAARLLSASGIRLELEFPPDLAPIPISSALRHEVAAMFKEALRNVVQHARATVVRIQMKVSATHLELEVRDNGRGFDPERDPQVPGGNHTVGGNGLRNLRERSQEIGGTCQVQSHANKGTSVQLRVPLDVPRANGRRWLQGVWGKRGRRMF